MTSTWVDLTVPLVSMMPRAFVYPEPIFQPTVIGTQPDGEPITATRIEMYSHVGTHIEAARHVFGSGRTLDEYSLDRFAGPGFALDLGSTESLGVGADDLALAAPPSLFDAFALLALTSGEGTRGAGEHRFLSEDGARWLVDSGVRVVGVDTSTVDMHVDRRPHRFDLPAHRVLLAAGVLILENLSPRVHEVVGRRMTVHAWPLSMTGSDSSPVRVVVAVDD